MSEKIDNLVEIFKNLDNNDIYEFLMDVGSQGSFPLELQTQKNFVNGCQSQVWLVGFPEDDSIKFYGTSDSFIVRGIVYIVCDIVSELSPKQLDDLNYQFFEPFGKFFTHQRRRGIQAMINKIKQINTAQRG